MRKIITPQLPGQCRLEVMKDLNGAIVVRIGSEAVALPPRQAYDLAILLLKQAGVEVNETAKRADGINGNPLMARMKIA